MLHQEIIDKYYPAGTRLRDILIGHCRQVADLALNIAATRGLDLEPDAIEDAAMLHDIGICRTDAPGIECHGTAPYLLHGTEGAAMLRAEGAPQWLADVAERHTGTGLTRSDFIAAGLTDPGHDLLPRTLLERLICYADKFFSKTRVGAPPKTIERVRASMARFGPDALTRFENLHAEFGA